MILLFRHSKNKEETRSFLGLVTYVKKCIPELADPRRANPIGESKKRKLLKI